MKQKLQDRRVAPRFVMLGEIEVFLDAIPMYLLDLSTGGFAVQSKTPFVESTTYTFVFRSARCGDLALRGVAIHSLHSVEAGESSYVAGFAFAPDTTEAERKKVTTLIRDVLTVRRRSSATDSSRDKRPARVRV